jgi:CHAT domain-containing protein
MQLLYEARFSHRMGTADAVRDATSRLLTERRAHGLSTHPFYWAAFVAAGDWK